jgi:hypothetical protein
MNGSTPRGSRAEQVHLVARRQTNVEAGRHAARFLPTESRLQPNREIADSRRLSNRPELPLRADRAIGLPIEMRELVRGADPLNRGVGTDLQVVRARI